MQQSPHPLLHRSYRPYVYACLVTCALGVLSACAGNGISDAALSGDPEAMWEDGKKAAARGQELVDAAEEELAEGRQLVREGEEKVDRGNAETLKARQEYQALARATGASVSPNELESEVKRLRQVGKRWEEAIDDIRDGNKMINRGNKMIYAAQADIINARALIETGSTLMRNSQRVKMGEGLSEQPVVDD